MVDHSGEDPFPPGRWPARFIWSAPPPVEMAGEAGQVRIDRRAARSWVLLRRTFHLDGTPDRAVARVTADSRYVLFVNGAEVSRGPIRANPLVSNDQSANPFR